MRLFITICHVFFLLLSSLSLSTSLRVCVCGTRFFGGRPSALVKLSAKKMQKCQLLFLFSPFGSFEYKSKKITFSTGEFDSGTADHDHPDKWKVHSITHRNFCYFVGHEDRFNFTCVYMHLHQIETETKKKWWILFVHLTTKLLPFEPKHIYYSEIIKLWK